MFTIEERGICICCKKFIGVLFLKGDIYCPSCGDKIINHQLNHHQKSLAIREKDEKKSFCVYSVVK